MCKSPGGGKALFFEKVRGSSFPVVTNIFGSFERMCLALEVQGIDDIAGRIIEMLNQSPPKTLMEKVAMLPKLFEFSRYISKRVKNAPCQEVIERDSPDLSIFPVLKCWPGDGQPTDEGRFITLPMVFTKDPETGRQNCGMYRIHVSCI
jgi:4-hydroxy-3-polyprenylbenzoate decarboxylase